MTAHHKSVSTTFLKSHCFVCGISCLQKCGVYFITAPQQCAHHFLELISHVCVRLSVCVCVCVCGKETHVAHLYE